MAASQLQREIACSSRDAPATIICDAYVTPKLAEPKQEVVQRSGTRISPPEREQWIK